MASIPVQIVLSRTGDAIVWICANAASVRQNRLAATLNRPGLLVLPPAGAPFDDVALFVTVQPMPAISEEMTAQLIFFGGFDPTSIALNHVKDTEFLAFAYP